MDRHLRIKVVMDYAASAGLKARNDPPTTHVRCHDRTAEAMLKIEE